MPPISRWTFLNVGAHAWLMRRPVSVEPVNEMTLTSGCASSGAPAPGPSPSTRFRTPLGRPASTSACTKLIPEAGASSAGLKTTVLPQTSAGRIFHDGTAIGKFQAVIIPHTPIGWRKDIANLSRSSEGTVWPYMRRPSPAINCAMSTASCTSPRVSSRIFPISRVIVAARASLRSDKICAARYKISARLGAGTSRQCGNAARAAATARLTSTADDLGTRPSRSSWLAGLRLSKVSADSAGTHSPSMKFRYVDTCVSGMDIGQRVSYPVIPCKVAASSWRGTSIGRIRQELVNRPPGADSPVSMG